MIIKRIFHIADLVLLALCCRDLVDSLRAVLANIDLDALDAGEEEAGGSPQDVYRSVNKVCGPVLRLLRGAQIFVSRLLAATEEVRPGASVVSWSTLHLLFPVVRGVLSLQAVIPGTEMAFYLLDRCG